MQRPRQGRCHWHCDTIGSGMWDFKEKLSIKKTADNARNQRTVDLDATSILRMARATQSSRREAKQEVPLSLGTPLCNCQAIETLALAYRRLRTCASRRSFQIRPMPDIGPRADKF